MANFNKIILLGNLTREPQLSYTPSQMAAAEFGIATNRRWKDKSGQEREETCFIDCRAYGRTAEIINSYLHKGDPLLVEGRLQFDQWTDREGRPRGKHRVFVENAQLLGARKPRPASPDEPARPVDGQTGGRPESKDPEDEIPF